MRFLVDGDLPRSTKILLQQYKHEAVDVRDINLRGAKDYQIASYARTNGLCILTGDFDFSDVRNYPPSQYAGLVVLKLPKNATASLIIKIVVNMKRVWRVIKIDLPDLKSKISRIFEDIS
jgi:predicted nuclease of predicted toxin-antitoxin system